MKSAMHELLNRGGYVLDEDQRTWIRPGFSSIAYSDGDSSEDRLLETLRASRDVSVFSTELRMASVDWPSTYHLSSERSNLLRPFSAAWGVDTRVLEVGAGCGAVTRFLGETGAQVLALEGSHRRSAIARERVRDLSNVDVLVERFQDFEPGAQFDVITLIGVLEYASVFSDAQQPALDMLCKVRSMLAPGGAVLLAIENRFGLKYLAGAPEDHLGKAMVGVEGRYHEDGVRTWGRFELDRLLSDAGFSQRDFHVPMPDYKMPVSIIGPLGISADAAEFDAGTLAAQAVQRDLQLGATTFNLQRAWNGVSANGLLLDLGNSFLIRAGDVDSVDEKVLAWHYSTQRAQRFARESRFMRADDGRIVVRSRGISGNAASDRELRMRVVEQADYYLGPLLVERFRAVMTQNDWRIDSLIEVTQEYLRHLKQIMAEDGFRMRDDDPEQVIPDSYIDATPFNLLCLQDGRVVYFDREWEVQAPSLGWLVVRSLIFTYAGTAVEPMRQCEGIARVGDLIAEVVHRLYPGSALVMDPAWLEAQVEREAHFQSEVKGTDQRHSLHNLMELELPSGANGISTAGVTNLRLQLDLVSQSLHAGVAMLGNHVGSLLQHQDDVSQSLHSGIAHQDSKLSAILEQQDLVSQSLHAGLDDLRNRFDGISASLAVGFTRPLATALDMETARVDSRVLGQRVTDILEQLDVVSQSLHGVTGGLTAGVSGVQADVVLANERADSMLKQIDAVSQSLHAVTASLAERVQTISTTIENVSSRQIFTEQELEKSFRLLVELKTRSDRSLFRRLAARLGLSGH